MTESVESRLNSCGRFSQDSPRCSPMQSQRFTEHIRRKNRKFHRKNSILCQCSTTFLVTRKTMNKNAWQMLRLSPYLRRSLVKDNSHFLVQVPRRSGILWKRIAHKEFGIIPRKRCWWNSPKADVQFSVQQLHCPGVSSKAKDMEHCRFTFLPLRQQLKLFFA